MSDSAARQVENLSSRVFVLERFLAAVLDTLVKRGRISHSDVALAIEQLEADLYLRGTGAPQVTQGLPTAQIKTQVAFFRNALQLHVG